MTRFAWRLALLALLPLCAAAADDDVRANYLLACRGCHLADGRGVPPEVPSLRDTLGALVASSAGRDYMVRVPGVLQSRLNNQQLADVLNWILFEFNANTLPADFRPFVASDVAAARQRVLADPVKFRASLATGSTIK